MLGDDNSLLSLREDQSQINGVLPLIRQQLLDPALVSVICVHYEACRGPRAAESLGDVFVRHIGRSQLRDQEQILVAPLSDGRWQSCGKLSQLNTADHG